MIPDFLVQNYFIYNKIENIHKSYWFKHAAKHV